MSSAYFDTSAINALTDDPSRDFLIANLTHSDLVIHSSLFNIMELAAFKNKPRITELFNIVRRVGKGFRPLCTQADILKRSLDAYAAGSMEFDASVGEEYNGVWSALQDPNLIDDQAIEECRKVKEREEKWLFDFHAQARPKFQELSRASSSLDKVRRLMPASYVLHFLNEEQFLEEVFSAFFGTCGYPNNFAGQAKRVLLDLHPWRVFFTAMALDIFNRAIKPEKFGMKHNPGGIDIKQSVYLPGVSVFVSNDKNQRRFLKNVCRISQTKTRIVPYDEFTRRLLANTL
ncbi:MAG: hypothetical protein WCU88_12750 [Elusimicrobiota bacterium]|jgi:hypothetical protein